MSNHPTLLAFGYTYMPLGGAGPYYGLVNAPSFEDFQARNCDLVNSIAETERLRTYLTPVP